MMPTPDPNSEELQQSVIENLLDLGEEDKPLFHSTPKDGEGPFQSQFSADDFSPIPDDADGAEEVGLKGPDVDLEEHRKLKEENPGVYEKIWEAHREWLRKQRRFRT